ncbi:hypothetical protein COT50_01970 [candidate division WWE3 bacterium CG08_land_8_20_14_0_20_41_10]|uniref:Uncharacterized protein n=1 Tax=candidate division WWE3 bacterium CG08_land_8_20_14_0_20_41_10 TaxID=1975085 RepID=A0A2H0XBX9_UNCKA|nr:MAG: hypothetical protein COT50_01970 [candidate division WWE3 bacterium CG08_land_8_20_14_0_20_41_10]
MIDKETKDRYIGIISSLGGESVASSFKEFLITFDGSNDKEFHLFLANFISLLISHRELQIKAGGYDKFTESSELTASQIENVKQRFDSLSRDEIPTMPISKPQTVGIPAE